MVESSGDATQAEVRRSLSVVGPDGVKYLILAAKRGVPFRAEALDGSAAGGSIVGSVVGWIIGSIVGAIAEIKAGDKTSWKLGVVRQRGFPQRIKQKESSCRRGSIRRRGWPRSRHTFRRAPCSESDPLGQVERATCGKSGWNARRQLWVDPGELSA